MKNLVRTLLVWLMLLAIPFQGLASAAMLACAHDAPAAPVHAVHHQADVPPASHCHDSGVHDSAASQHHQDPQSGHDHDRDHGHDGRCSACAACCMGAAMAPAPALATAPPQSAQLRVPATVARPSPVDLALPERPPRPSLA